MPALPAWPLLQVRIQLSLASFPFLWSSLASLFRAAEVLPGFSPAFLSLSEKKYKLRHRAGYRGIGSVHLGRQKQSGIIVVAQRST